MLKKKKKYNFIFLKYKRDSSYHHFSGEYNKNFKNLF